MFLSEWMSGQVSACMTEHEMELLFKLEMVHQHHCRFSDLTPCCIQYNPAPSNQMLPLNLLWNSLELEMGNVPFQLSENGEKSSFVVSCSQFQFQSVNLSCSRSLTHKGGVSHFCMYGVFCVQCVRAMYPLWRPAHVVLFSMSTEHYLRACTHTHTK